MHTATTIADIRTLLATERSHGRPIGFVPTMGALHAGHAALIERSVAECAATVVSVFLNPLQFGAGEDLERYPAAPEADRALCRDLGVNHLFVPTTAGDVPATVGDRGAGRGVGIRALWRVSAPGISPGCVPSSPSCSTSFSRRPVPG
jgi:pantoate--beta-alanine ligase